MPSNLINRTGAGGASAPGTHAAADTSPAAQVRHRHPEAAAELAAEARQAERERIAAILDAEEAQGRAALARHFATQTDMEPEQAKVALGAAPGGSSGAYDFALGGRDADAARAAGYTP